MFFHLYSINSCAVLCLQIAREMVISPRNARLGFATLTNRVGLANRADTTDGELIKYRVHIHSLTLI